MQDDGATLREHYEGLAERTGRSIAEIANLPALPTGAERLWIDFLDLSSARGSTGFGPARISWLDLDAYQRVKRLRFCAWEIDAIRRADNAYMEQAGKRKPKN